MQEEAVLPAELVAHLPRGFQERLGFDIADGPTHLGDHYVRPVAVGVGQCHLQDPALDLVSDVRNHLHGVTEVLAAAFPSDHLRIHLSGGDIRRSRQVAIEESLVMADVEIGLRAVLGDEHLAMLERVHGARINIEVRVEFLHGHLQATRGEQLAETAGGQAFSERGDDAAGDEDVFRGGLLVLAQCGQEQPP